MKVQILLSFFALLAFCSCEKESTCKKTLFLVDAVEILPTCENAPQYLDSIRTVTIEGQTVCIGILNYYTLEQTENEAKNFDANEYRQGQIESALKIENDSARFERLATVTAYWPSIRCIE